MTQPDVPTIAALITAYRDATGDSYRDMARRTGDEISQATLQKLGTQPPRGFPKLPRTLELLAAVLDVPVMTVVQGFAAGLGLTVRPQTDVMWLPPGTDRLTAGDRDAIRSVTRALIDARTATPAASGDSNVVQLRPDLDSPALVARSSDNEGARKREGQDTDAERPQD